MKKYNWRSDDLLSVIYNNRRAKKMLKCTPGADNNISAFSNHIEESFSMYTGSDLNEGKFKLLLNTHIF